MQGWWMVVVGPALAGMGYLVRRLLEGRRRGETLKRRLQALALKAPGTSPILKRHRSCIVTITG